VAAVSFQCVMRAAFLLHSLYSWFGDPPSRIVIMECWT
jgi:hypothetical protein